MWSVAVQTPLAKQLNDQARTSRTTSGRTISEMRATENRILESSVPLGTWIALPPSIPAASSPGLSAMTGGHALPA